MSNPPGVPASEIQTALLDMEKTLAQGVATPSVPWWARLLCDRREYFEGVVMFCAGSERDAYCFLYAKMRPSIYVAFLKVWRGSLEVKVSIKAFGGLLRPSSAEFL